MFKKAERKKVFLKIALNGPSGSGKTYSALQMAQGMGNKIAMIDTENGSGELYSNLCDYDVAQIAAPFTVDKYVSAIREAEQAGYDVLIIDSLSHAWNGAGGLLEEQERIARTKYKGNTWAAWRDITPLHDKLVSTILQSKLHVIATMRTKTEYMQTDDKKIKKVGMAPQQREGMDYEFTVVFDIDREKHEATASKDRTNLFDNVIGVITPQTGKTIMDWALSGKDVPPEPVPAPAAQATKQAYPMVVIDANGICSIRKRTGYAKVMDLTYDELKQAMELSMYAEARPYMEKALHYFSQTAETTDQQGEQ